VVHERHQRVQHGHSGLGPPATWTVLGDTNGYIFWRDTSGDIALWGLQNGQVATSNGLGTVTSNFVVQGFGDFNGDGFPDILWRDTNSGIISIWFTNGEQVTSAGVVSTLPSSWNIVQVGDYNGEGISDLLLIDTAGDVAMWLMSGTTVSQSLGVANVGPGWTAQNVNAN
jgi:FG-GAP-like repeat